MKIPRTTGQQIELGKTVSLFKTANWIRGKSISLKKTKKGDLVFFAFGKSKRKVTHVGLISKNNNPTDIDFIHASSSRGVVETQLIKEYYIKRIRKIKRVF